MRHLPRANLQGGLRGRLLKRIVLEAKDIGLKDTLLQECIHAGGRWPSTSIRHPGDLLLPVAGRRPSS
jgi:hypothetical protein